MPAELNYEAYLAAIVHWSEDAVISKNLDGIVTSWNAAAERLLGFTADEMIGRSILKIIPQDRRTEEESILATIRAGEIVHCFETERRHKNGDLKQVSLTISAIKNANGDIIGISKIARDINDEKQLLKLQRRVFEEEDSARKRALEREKATRSAAEKANRLKDEFLGTLSHELRTPLSAILGWTHVLESEKSDAAMRTKAVAAIKRSAEVQKKLISDLLDVSMIISGTFSIQSAELDVSQLIQSVTDAIRPVAKLKDITIALSMQPDVSYRTLGDAHRISQAVSNLLDNAIKFTPNDGHIDVLLTQRKGNVEITVNDDGPGMHPEFLSVVFERFRQADSLLIPKHGGLGLGLAIVRAIIELHGGTVHADNRQDSFGSSFAVSFPMRTVDAGVSRQISDESHAAFGKGILLQNIHVLAVDDEPDSLEVQRYILEQQGARVTTARSAREALIALRTEPADILLSDISMPEADGFQLLRLIRQLPKEQGGLTPAVALTAHASDNDRRQALAAGFQAHIGKPVDVIRLVNTVAALTAKT